MSISRCVAQLAERLEDHIRVTGRTSDSKDAGLEHVPDASSFDFSAW